MKFGKYIHFRPRLFADLKNYNKEKLFKDLLSGLIVGIVALPLAIAFGIASGVSPEKGIITAIVAGFLISFFGGSDVQIGGPTGAFIVIVYGIVQQFGEKGLIIATIMAGLILLLMGFFKLGSVIKFIPYPIVIGFTSGIAITIFSTQINDFFGLNIQNIPSDFIHKWITYFQNFSNINYIEFFVGFISLLIIIISPKIVKRIPGALFAIIISTIVVYFLNKLNIFGTQIETIGSRYTIDSSIPRPVTPKIDFLTIKLLIPAAFSIAMLGAIESLLSATVADGVSGKKHDSNTELIGQGIANIISPLFGGIPATGAIARTMTNINNGGKTPIAGITHSIVLLLILLFLGKLTKYIPMACLAAILIIVAYNMSEWRTFISMLKNPVYDVIILLLTLFLTVIFDLTVAIQFGLLLAAILFMKRVYDTSKISVITDVIDVNQEIDVKSGEEELVIPKGAEIYEIDGPFFFGIANKLEEMMALKSKKPIVRVIRMRKVPFIDSTGIHNLRMLYRSSKHSKIEIVLSGVNEGVLKALSNAGVVEEIGKENICPHIDIALNRTKEIIKEKKH